MTKSTLSAAAQVPAYPDPERAEVLLRLGDEITQLSAHLDAGTYRLLELLATFDERGGWHGTGIHSCAHWLNWRCGMNIGAARERVRVARALPGLPKISSAFRAGRVSFSKVRAMTRVATAANEDVLLDVALGGTANHVERQVSVYRHIKRADALQLENLRHTQRELSWFEDDDGSWVFKGRFTPEQGALISKALDTAMDQLFIEQKGVPEEVSAETSSRLPLDRPVPQGIASRRADALQRVAEAFLLGTENHASGGERYVVNIHTEMETLKTDGTGAESELEDSGHVSAETSRRLSCDCSVVHWRDAPSGEPLNIGRKTRIVPPAIRRALQRRDGGCRFPGCTCTRFVDAHHVMHWADGGETSMENLVLLCRRHHRLVHEEGFGVQAGPLGPINFTINFTLPSGKVIPPCPAPRFRGNVFELESRNHQLGLNITPKTPVPSWLGERMDYSIAVEGLLRRE